MRGRIEAVCVSRGGLPKLAVPSAFARRGGLEGDAHNHPALHGGPERALLLMAAESLERLRAEGFAVGPGVLGENLTTRGLDFNQLSAGMRLRAGGAMIELTGLRRPCRQLDFLNGDRPGLIQQLLKEEPLAGGWYARVLLAGLVRAGDPIELVEAAV